MWLTNTLPATLITCFYPGHWVAPANTAGSAEVKAQDEARIGGLFDSSMPNWRAAAGAGLPADVARKIAWNNGASLFGISAK